MRIALLMRTGKAYDDVQVSKNYRPWLQKSVSPEEAIYRYLQYKYPEMKIDTFTVNTIHKLDYKKYKYVFVLFVDFVMTFLKMKKDKYKSFISKINRIPNLIPNKKYIKFITDKCKYYTWLKKYKYPILSTTCLNLNSKSFPKKLKLKQNRFLKPTPSAESKNTFVYTKENTKQTSLNSYIQRLKKKYNKLIIQNYIKTFGKKDNKELKTYWVDTEYMYSIEITGTGMKMGEQTVRKSIPNQIKMISKRLIKQLKLTFKTPMLITRIDWGKHDNKYFINEIEYAPGTYAELFNNEWKLDKKIGDNIYKLIK